jgi:hypothetical protein
MSFPLSNAGFTVLQARYPGSLYGKFGSSTSIEGSIKDAELLSKGMVGDLATEKEVLWSINRVVL